jgi:hypothetical protein
MASCVVGRHARVGQPVLDVVHLGFHVEQRLERAADFLEHRAATVRQAVLRQVADRQRRRLDDLATVGLVDAGEHLEQRGLAGAVRPAQADTVSVADLPRDVVDERAVAEGFLEV